MTPNYTLTVGNHVVQIATTAGPTGLGSSTVWVRPDGGEWTRSRIASMHKLAALFCDAEDVVAAWGRVVGEAT